MIVFLVMQGFDRQYIYWDIGLLEFNLLFLNTIKIRLRELQQAGLCLTGSIGVFFAKKNEKTYFDILAKQIKNIDATGEEKEKAGLTSEQFEDSFKSFSSVIPIIKGKPPKGIE